MKLTPLALTTTALPFPQTTDPGFKPMSGPNSNSKTELGTPEREFTRVDDARPERVPAPVTGPAPVMEEQEWAVPVQPDSGPELVDDGGHESNWEKFEKFGESEESDDGGEDIRPIFEV